MEDRNLNPEPGPAIGPVEAAMDAIEQIKAKHSELRGKIEDPYLHVGAAVIVDTELQMTPGQLGLTPVMADKHGRLWMQGQFADGHSAHTGWVLAVDPGHHRMGGRLREKKIDTSDIPEASEDWFKNAKLRSRRLNDGVPDDLVKQSVLDTLGMIGEVMTETKLVEPRANWDGQTYTAKPEIVRAWQVQLPGPCPSWLLEAARASGAIFNKGNHFAVIRRGGSWDAEFGSWIVMDAKGVLSGYTDEDFRAKYEASNGS